jgi:SAM-dependent methyltransferase
LKISSRRDSYVKLSRKNNRRCAGSAADVDFLQEFLVVLQSRADREGLGDRITILAASMEARPFEEASFDAIWSEGAIYNMGLANGIKVLWRFLKPGGILTVSELTWLTRKRPMEIEQHWRQEYPEVDTASAKMKLLEECGYSPVGYFTLSERSWRFLVSSWTMIDWDFWDHFSIKRTTVSGLTPSCFMAAAPASLFMIASNAVMSGMSMLNPTSLGLSG